MIRTELYAFCQRHNIFKMDVQYRNDQSYTKFGIAVAEPLDSIVKLEIPETNLIGLVLIEQAEEKFREQDARDEELRELYPSVKKAYEDYQLLLKLTQKAQSNDI